MNTLKKLLKHCLTLALCLSLLFCAVCRAEVSENSQSLSLTGVGNARELGGYKTEDGRTVKRGVLLRTAKLANAKEEDMERLRSVYHLAVMWISGATARWKERQTRKWRAWNT